MTDITPTPGNTTNPDDVTPWPQPLTLGLLTFKPTTAGVFIEDERGAAYFIIKPENVAEVGEYLTSLAKMAKQRRAAEDFSRDWPLS